MWKTHCTHAVGSLSNSSRSSAATSSLAVEIWLNPRPALTSSRIFGGFSPRCSAFKTIGSHVTTDLRSFLQSSRRAWLIAHSICRYHARYELRVQGYSSSREYLSTYYSDETVECRHVVTNGLQIAVKAPDERHHIFVLSEDFLCLAL